MGRKPKLWPKKKRKKKPKKQRPEAKKQRPEAEIVGKKEEVQKLETIVEKSPGLETTIEETIKESEEQPEPSISGVVSDSYMNEEQVTYIRDLSSSTKKNILIGTVAVLMLLVGSIVTLYYQFTNDLRESKRINYTKPSTKGIDEASKKIKETTPEASTYSGLPLTKSIPEASVHYIPKPEILEEKIASIEEKIKLLGQTNEYILTGETKIITEIEDEYQDIIENFNSYMDIKGLSRLDGQEYDNEIENIKEKIKKVLELSDILVRKRVIKSEKADVIKSAYKELIKDNRLIKEYLMNTREDAPFYLFLKKKFERESIHINFEWMKNNMEVW